MTKSGQTSFASVEHTSCSIPALRGRRVLLDDLYGLATKALPQAARRNRERFPEDLMIQLPTPSGSS